MKAQIAIWVVTIRQLVSAKRNWALVAVALLPAFVMYLAGRSMTERRAFEFFNEAPLAILMLLVVPVISLIMAASTLGEERRQATLSFITLRPLARWKIVVAKGAAAWMVCVALSGISAVLAALALMATGDASGVIGPLLLAVALNTAGYSAIFVPLGYVTDRAVLVGLGFLFIWESGLASAVAALTPFSVSRIGLSAYTALVEGAEALLEEPLGSVAPGAGGALAKALVLAALGVIVTSYLLKRRDLT